jgi:hypothetical protein
MTNDVKQAIQIYSASSGIDPATLYAVIMHESGGDSGAVGDNGKSHGLFQVYTTVHPDYDIAKGKKDIMYQFDYMIGTLTSANAMGKSAGLSGVDLALYVEKFGERPVWTASVESRIRRYYKEYGGSSTDFTTTNVSTTKSSETKTSTVGTFLVNAIRAGILTAMTAVILALLFKVFAESAGEKIATKVGSIGMDVVTGGSSAVVKTGGKTALKSVLKGGVAK